MKWLMEQNLALNGIFIFMGNNTALPASASSLILSFVVCSLLTGTLGKVEAKSVHCNKLLLYTVYSNHVATMKHLSGGSTMLRSAAIPLPSAPGLNTPSATRQSRHRHS